MTSSSSSTAKLMEQTEMKVVKGYAYFTKLGITEKSSFSLSFSFKTPEGVNETKFDPQVLPPVQLEAKDPILSCSQYNLDLSIEQNENFNLTVSIIDKTTKLKVENISWANYQWMAKVKVHSLGYHKAAGLLNVANATVKFDSTSGLAQFDNLIITEPGMYVLTLSVYTTNSNYDFSCYSKSITVLKTGTVLPPYNVNSPPDYVLKYEGDYNSIGMYYDITHFLILLVDLKSILGRLIILVNTLLPLIFFLKLIILIEIQEPEEIKANMYNFMTKYDIIVQNIKALPGSVYVTFYSSDTSSNLVDVLSSSGVDIDPKLKYTYASINDQIVNCTNCILVTSTEPNSNTQVCRKLDRFKVSVINLFFYFFLFYRSWV